MRATLTPTWRHCFTLTSEDGTSQEIEDFDSMIRLATSLGWKRGPRCLHPVYEASEYLTRLSRRGPVTLP